MIKGIIALFTTGIIFNPMAWAGIGAGLYMMFNFNMSQIHELAQNWRVHAGVLAIAAVYTLIFKRIYHSGANGVNWKATIKGILGRYFYILFVTVVTCLCFVGYQLGTSEETQQQILNNKNVRILSDEARSAYEAPKLPDEKF